MSFVLSRLCPLILVLLLIYSCSENTGFEKEPEEEKEHVEDDYAYLVLENTGKLHTIGDKTGIVSTVGEIEGLKFNTVFNSVTSSSTKIYIYEAQFDPPRGNLFILDRENLTSEMVVLDFPEEFGDNPGLQSLDWMESNGKLIGVVRPDFDLPTTQGPIKLVEINPENFEIKSFNGLNFYTEGYQNFYSSTLRNEELYISASKNGDFLNNDFLRINLNELSYEVLPQGTIETGILSIGGNASINEIFVFAPLLNTGRGNASKPYLFDIDSNELTEIVNFPEVSEINLVDKIFYNPFNNGFVNIIGYNSGISLMIYKAGNDETEYVNISNPELLSSGTGIIDVLSL